MNKGSFLNYYKTILEKVSFDEKLLKKEYNKAKELLDGPEARDLEYWVDSKGLLRKTSHLPNENIKSRVK